MPGKHTAKERRQAKHIVAGYKKRGVPMRKAKSIAWATVTKQQNESWMFNGAGQSVFIGNQGPVSQFDPSGSVSPGASYIPDEVAKMLVKEGGLRKTDTISKKVIEGYLESMRLSRGLAVDVARVLRDVYGVTPTFDESTLYARSGALIEELSGVVSESYPMPFAVEVEDETEELNEVGIISSFIQNEYMNSTDESYDLVLGHLAMLSPQDFSDIVDFHEWVGPEVFDYIESIAVSGPNGAAEQIVEGLCWPHRIQFMPEHIQELFEKADDELPQAKQLPSPKQQKQPKAKQLPPPKKQPKAEQPKAEQPKSPQQKLDASRGGAPKSAAARAALGLGPAPASKASPPHVVAAAAARAARGLGPKPSGPAKSIDGPELDSKPEPDDDKDDVGARSEFKKRLDALARKKDKDREDSNARGFHAQRTAEKADAEKADAEKADAEKSSDHSPSGMKKAGGKAVGLMKKIGGGLSNIATTAVTHGGRIAGGAAGGFAGGFKQGWDKFHGDVKNKVANIHAHGSTKDPDPGSEGAKNKEQDAARGPKRGLISRAIRRFGQIVRNVKSDFKSGYDAERSSAAPEKEAAPSGEAAPDKERVKKSGVKESVYRSGSLLHEVALAFDGESMPDEEPVEDLVRSPADVVGAFEGTTVVDMAVLEAISEMDWNGVANLAGFMTLVPERFLGLIQAFKESTSAFRAEWVSLDEGGWKPDWMNIGSFVALTKLSTDEGVIPRLVYWAGRTLQRADESVAAYVAEAYPELGKTVYGPAGDPKEGPRLAKSFLTPHPAGTMTPKDSDCTTRMFSDPEDREKERKSKLADVMAALDGMRSQAAAAGVPPEGMFLNLYRDMHREKVRYS